VADSSAASPLRILAIRFSSIGDVLLTTPLIRAVRARYPAAHLASLTKLAFAPLLSDNPRLDEAITLAPDQSLTSLARDLRARRFTHIMDLHGSLRTRMLRFLVPGKWSGYRKHRIAREILIRYKKNVYPREIPVPERYFDAATTLAVKPDGGPPEFFLHPQAQVDVATWLLASDLPSDRGLVAVAPGAAHNTKRWPGEYWRDLVQRLTSDGQTIVVVGGPEDLEIGNAVAEAGGTRAVNVAGKFGLQGTGALLARCGLVVSGDTGVMHMATGVNTPLVALFGPTVRAFGFFPYSPRAVILERDLDCRPCTAWGTERCPLGHHRCLRDISVAQVQDVVRRMAG
jgi:lipopolysaccharide heptosyltransferase II